MRFDNILSGANRKESFYIPKEMNIIGSFKADTSGQIAGTITGDILVKDKLVILKEGVVNGDISSEELIVYGKIYGDIRRCDKMTVRSGAMIMGNINTNEIHIEKDAVIEGIITKSGTNTIISKKAEPKEKKSEQIEKPSHNEPGITTERHAWF